MARSRNSFPRRLVPILSIACVLAALILLPDAGLAQKRATPRRHSLDRRIEAILRRSEARRGFWGIEVARLKDGKALYTRNKDRLFLPGSNMKLFTTAAAVEKLGPAFVFRTTVESDTRPDAAGRVGDLLLVGRGDPNLSGRVLPYQVETQWQAPADKAFQELADQVAAQGVKEVSGNLVADDSYFLFEPYSHEWTQEDLQWGFGAPVTALAFNDNALFLRVQPGRAVVEKAQVWLDPIPDYYKINNQVETVAAGSKKQIFLERTDANTRLDIWGQIPLGASEDQDTVAIVNPPQLAGDLFRRALETRGIKVRGQVEVRHVFRVEAALGDPFPKPPPRVVLAEHASMLLREDIKVINKVSQNLHAEMLLRTLGRELENYGSLTVGLQVLAKFCAEIGIKPEEVVFRDGSGLSREALISPHAVIMLLRHMAASARFDVFYDSLPVAGVDGTLSKRFTGTHAQGRIHAKTGTLDHVNALSGYMEMPSGRRLAFSIIGNSHPLEAQEGAAVLDQIALAMFEWFGGRRAKPYQKAPAGKP